MKLTSGEPNLYGGINVNVFAEWDLVDLPVYLELPNGTIHRLWLDGCKVIRVEGETISIELAQSEISRIAGPPLGENA